MNNSELAGCASMTGVKGKRSGVHVARQLCGALGLCNDTQLIVSVRVARLACERLLQVRRGRLEIAKSHVDGPEP